MTQVLWSRISQTKCTSTCHSLNSLGFESDADSARLLVKMTLEIAGVVAGLRVPCGGRPEMAE